MYDDNPVSPAPVSARSQGLITGRPPTRIERLLGPYAALLGNRSLTFLLLAHSLSALIDLLYVVALFILAYGLTHSATVVALITFTRLLPYGLLLPFSGAITDRLNPRVLMVLANLGRAAAILVLLFVQSKATLPLAFPLVFVVAVLTSLFRPALLASVPRAVPERQLIEANSMLGQVDMVAWGAGPAVAGFITLVSTEQVALVAASAGLVLSAFAAWAAGALDRGSDDTAESGGLSVVLDGLRFLLQGNDRVLLGIAIAWAGMTFFGGACFALSVVLADHVYGFGAARVGYLNAAYAVGGMIGGFLVAPALSRWSGMLLFVVCAAASAVSEMLYGFSPAGVLPLVLWAVTGLVDAFAKITATTSIQAATPRQLLGRVFGAFESIFIFAMVLGSLVVGPLIDLVGVRMACLWLAIAGLGLLGVGLPFIVRMERVLGVRLFLFQVPTLNLLPFEAMGQVVRLLQPRSYRRGDTIVREGEAGESMYIVRSGRVTVSAGNDDPGQVLTVLGRADYFGEIALLRDTPRTATCRCISDVEVYILDGAKFRELVDSSAEFGEAIRAEGDARHRVSLGLLPRM